MWERVDGGRGHESSPERDSPQHSSADGWSRSGSRTLGVIASSGARRGERKRVRK